MIKTGLINAIAAKSKLTKRDCEKMVETMLEVITDTLAAGEDIKIVGHWVLSVKDRAARIGRNPKTKEPVEIPARRAVHFKAGSVLRNAVEGAVK